MKMKVTANHIKEIRSEIQNALLDVQSDSQELNFEIDLDNGLVFHANVFVGTHTTSEGDGWNEPTIHETVIIDIHIDNQIELGVYDDEMNQCYLTPEQKQLIKSDLEI